MLISIVVPAFNEQDSVAQLHREVDGVCAEHGLAMELIFVDDGSSDATPQRLETLANEDARVGVVRFRRNFGKAAALHAGFQRARGDVVITMDADLQDDPAEIPRFLERIAAGADVVSGWKKVRNDPVDKTLPSRVFNAVVSRVSGVKLHDFNCGFKVYRREALNGLSLYGELHRFIPVLLHWRGFRVEEMVVNHRPRQFGHSKYGVERLVKGFFDLLTVVLMTRFVSRPLHIFGAIGLLFGALGMLCLGYLTILWFAGMGPIGDRPMMMLGLLLIVVGVQMVSTGLLAEFMQTHSGGDTTRYVVASERLPSTVETSGAAADGTVSAR
ncbi:MAG: glycosyltransferase family 2 protein [Alphaproteobacteria bacterium]